MRRAALGLAVMVVALGGCTPFGGGSGPPEPIVLTIQVAPPEPPEVDTRDVLHVADVDAAALGLPDPDVHDHVGTFALDTDREVSQRSSFEYCLEVDAPITLDGEPVGVVEAGTCMRAGTSSLIPTVEVDA